MSPGRTIHLGEANQTPWSSGLCDCTSDVKNCCITALCPCITFGRISEIVDRGSTSCATKGAIYVLMSVFGCGWIYSYMNRSKLRTQNNLTKEPCGDCLIHFCCEHLALCQEHRQLQHQGFNMSIGWQENKEGQNQSVAMAPSAENAMYR